MPARILSRTSFGQGVIVLALGTLLAAALWWAAGAERAWLGYLLAAVTWPAWGPARALPTAAGDPAPEAFRTARTTTPATPVRFADLSDGVYDVVPDASHVAVRARKLRLLDVAARLDAPSGSIVLFRGEVTAELEVAAATFRSGNARRDVHVLGPAFLDARHHPTLRFTTRRAPTGGQGPSAAAPDPVDDLPVPPGTRSGTDGSVVRVPGRLEVLGRRVPIEWTVTELTQDPASGEVGVRATTSVRRSDFGMRSLLWLAGDEVGVDVVVAARRRPIR